MGTPAAGYSIRSGSWNTFAVLAPRTAMSNCMAIVDSGESWQFIRFERETRYYELRLQRDLFGWVVVKIWGRKSSRLGQMRTTPCSSFIEASRLWDAGVRARERRGYVPTTETH